MPFGRTERLYAPGLRLLSFSKALLDAGLAVDILEVDFSLAKEGGSARLHRLERSEVEAAPGEPDRFRDIVSSPSALPPAPPPELVGRVLQSGAYRAVVSTTDIMNDACARSCGELPLWCDFNGYCMAERQSLAAVYDSDGGLADQWDYLLPALLRADRFSTCSEAQRLTLIGELGACGRLNRLTHARDIVWALHPAVIFERFVASGRAFRGTLLPEDAFVALWSGGYNTWADIELLSESLVAAMRELPFLYFVSTGGAIFGHDDRSFARFQESVARSEFADRFLFAGWVPTEEVPNYYLEADVALNCDRANIDSETGCRNRIMDWVAAELPVVSTGVCELTIDLGGRGLIDVCHPGAPADFTRLLIQAARRSPEATARRVARAREYLLDKYSPERRYAPLCEWALSPDRAPDLGDASSAEAGLPFQIPDNALASRRAKEWLDRRGVNRVGDESAPDEKTSKPGLLRRCVDKLRS